MDQSTVKICPDCRLRNEAVNKKCQACGSDLQNVLAQIKGASVSMFGSSPIESNVVPLKSTRAVESVAVPYGKVAQNTPEKNSNNCSRDKQEHKAAKNNGIEELKTAAGPKKPWE